MSAKEINNKKNYNKGIGKVFRIINDNVKVSARESNSKI